jgi:hypothetical protein
MDFFSNKELVTQTGHDVQEWPLVIVKELMDNGLDACEEADVAPTIDVVADPCGITVRDNGPGLPEATLEEALKFTVRVSNREAYVSPSRGAQGNALKTLLPMPHVVDPHHGRLTIVAQGRRHEITCGADPISQRAFVQHDVTDLAKSKDPHPQAGEEKQALFGTEVRLEWSPRADEGGEVVWPFDGLSLADEGGFPDRFRALVEGFAVFNRHATISLTWFGRTTTWEATDPSWSKWKPCQPTSAHWYKPQHLERLIGAYICHEKEAGVDRLVSELVAEFDGLSGSQKRTRVLDDAGLKRAHLSDLVANGRLDSARITLLLDAMKKHTRPVKAKRLGLIGEDHLKARLLGMGVRPESFRYSRKFSEADAGGVPGVLESAFGWLGDEAPDARKIYSGANWSAAIRNPFRSFGQTGEGLDTALAHARATRDEPVVFVLHLAQPRVEYTDRGKSALVVGT